MRASNEAKNKTAEKPKKQDEPIADIATDSQFSSAQRIRESSIRGSDTVSSSKRTLPQKRDIFRKKTISRSSPSVTDTYDYASVSRNRVGYKTTMRACVAMLQALESYHEKSPMIPEPTFLNPPDNSLDDRKLDELEHKIELLENHFRSVSRRANEWRRGQMLLKERLFDLENSLHQSKEIKFIQSLLNVVPTEEDIKLIEKMKELEAKKLEINRQIRSKESQNRILNDIMSRAEAIITDSRIIKKQKRVVIIEQEPRIIGESYGADGGGGGGGLGGSRGVKTVLPLHVDEPEDDTREYQLRELETIEEKPDEELVEDKGQEVTVTDIGSDEETVASMAKQEEQNNDEVPMPIEVTHLIVDEKDLVSRRLSRDRLSFSRSNED